MSTLKQFERGTKTQDHEGTKKKVINFKRHTDLGSVLKLLKIQTQQIFRKPLKRLTSGSLTHFRPLFPFYTL